MRSIDCIEDSGEEAVGLLTTYRCNLNCKYCYIRVKQNKEMSLEKAQAILEPFLMKSEGLLTITFMGGETLLAMGMIRPLIEWIESRKCNRPYRFFGSTNGTLLTNDLKDWLEKYRHLLTLGLSYDGIPSAQVNNRGNDNIDIDFFIKTWPKQPIQMTINTESVGEMACGVVYLLEKGALVHPNVAYEEKDWPQDKIIEYGRQLNFLIYYYNSHPEKPLVSQFIHNLCDYAESLGTQRVQNEICGAGDGFQVFDTDGKSYPCHLLSPLVLRGEKLKQARCGLISPATDFSDPKCLGCPYISSCPTCIGCNFLYRNGLNIRDTTHCKIMKMEVKAFIKKEVLRLRRKRVLSPVDASEIDAIKKLIDYQSLI